MEIAELAVFVRAPVEGSVKTRLHGVLGADGATELYRAFVEDVLGLCRRAQEAGRIRLALWADDASDPVVTGWADSLDVEPQQQPSGDLGIRLGTAFSDGLARAERVVVIGSDAPTLPFSVVASAFDALAHVPLVLGPSNDGGYTLIGASGAPPSFTSVRWSTEHAQSDTRRANASLELRTLSPWYDVDDETDLVTLRAHLSASPGDAPVTAAWLSRRSTTQR